MQYFLNIDGNLFHLFHTVPVNLFRVLIILRTFVRFNKYFSTLDFEDKKTTSAEVVCSPSQLAGISFDLAPLALRPYLSTGLPLFKCQLL